MKKKKMAVLITLCYVFISFSLSCSSHTFILEDVCLGDYNVSPRGLCTYFDKGMYMANKINVNCRELTFDRFSHSKLSVKLLPRFSRLVIVDIPNDEKSYCDYVIDASDAYAVVVGGTEYRCEPNIVS